MECKVSDLVKRGHDQAAELKSSCGAVDVREVAQLISDMATQLDCTAAALREMTKQRNVDRADVLAWEKTMFKACGEDGLKSVADKFAELKSQCAALAADSGILLAIMNEQAGSFGAALAEGFHDAVMESGIDQLIDIYQRRLQQAIQCIPPTPDTDAFLAEVRAQGVEMLAEHLSGMNISASETSVRDFAAQLRKGVQS